MHEAEMICRSCLTVNTLFLRNHSLMRPGISNAVAQLLPFQSNQTTFDGLPDSHSTIHKPAFQRLDYSLLCYQEFQGRTMVSGCSAVVQPVDSPGHPLCEYSFPFFDLAASSLTRCSHGSNPETDVEQSTGHCAQPCILPACS